jgi:hypothetical protein
MKIEFLGIEIATGEDAARAEIELEQDKQEHPDRYGDTYTFAWPRWLQQLWGIHDEN